ncbi:hypothetical protein [Pluralibacter gergoviae]|uniref:hypothetical protein n=1 Tax=Pluralibacter gergoviae TaxID=61647 RepID=UPI000A374AB6|nr:hypothetical protein [Pluralibacter gergoviae]EKT9641085.1 hypothetical protein [Pluralibacter gergoviae]EKV0930869.1 hypothetical protein [Pluralibacter gergoviae]EKV3546351.1 hypothetical protein [Pluralibacter gergoviae]EKV6247075.1 hypothetical protein [Pluralibacter gergoviae]EKV9901415.1 hypothetical protein [Pluralibacter gergoviae]
MNRYNVSGNEGLYQPNSGRQVLANKLGIHSLMISLMAVQASYQPLNYHVWEQHKPRYISAIHKGVSMNYEPMEQLVSAALRHD